MFGMILTWAMSVLVVGLRRRRKRRIPILLITDIGRDIDDTLALLAIKGYEDVIELVGVVATGGNGANRAYLARAWLYHLNLKAPVCACLSGGKDEIEFPTFLCLESVSKTGDNTNSVKSLVSNLLRKHCGLLRIVAIAPLSPLLPLVSEPTYLSLLRSHTHSIWIQGQFTQDQQQRIILPDIINAYNLRIDEKASREVFRNLQHDVPFRFFGKHAAYQVSLTPQDFVSFDNILPVMSNMARQCLKPFRTRRPDLFHKLYGGNNVDDEEWFKHLNALSHPYDAALIVALVHETVLRNKIHTHKHVGNSPCTSLLLRDEHVSLVHSELVRTIETGLNSIVHNDTLR